MKPFADSHIHMTDVDNQIGRAFLDLLASIPITDATLLSLPYRGDNYNIRLLYWKKNYSGIKLRVFGALHDFGIFSSEDPLEQTKKLIAMGCDGMKYMEMDPLIHKELGYGLNHPKYDAMFSYLEENDLPVCFHVADPEEFWEKREMTEAEIARGWYYGDGTFPSKEQLYQETFEVLEKHPKLRVSLAHFFFLSNFPKEAVRVFETYPNVMLDLTPGSEMCLGFSKNIEVWHDIFEKYSSRILFGTDSNSMKGEANIHLHRHVCSMLSHDHSEFNRPAFTPIPIRGLALSEETIEKICYTNYLRFVGETPREVRWDAVMDEAVRMIGILRKTPTEKLVCKWTDEARVLAVRQWMEALVGTEKH